MPTNNQTDACISTEGEALVFWAPGRQPRRLNGRVQIIDVFSLQLATGYSRDPQGRLLLEAQTSVAAGRSWSLAKAIQLIRNDARPHRWVALQMDKRAWGLFWAGGGLQRCRELLADLVNDAEASSALVPATLEAAPPGMPPRSAVGVNPWQLVAWTSLAWLVVLGITVAGLLAVMERQDRKLELLLQRTAPAESVRP